MSNATDLDVRRTGIGGSDISVIAGLNPFRSPFELYLEKRGDLAPLDISERDPVMLGQLFEDGIAQAYCLVRTRREGHEVKVRRSNVTHRHPRFPWAIAHIDRFIIGEERGLECKNVGAFSRAGEWGPDGTDVVPDYMLLQCQWYMAILEWESMDLASVHGGSDFRIHTITRHQELIDDLLALAADFWRAVEAANAPEIDWQSERTADVLRRLYPDTDGALIEADTDVMLWHGTLERAKEQRDLYENVVRGAKNHLLNRMGNASFLRFPDGSGYTRKAVKRSAYTVEASSYVDFRFTKTLKGRGE